ncbi:phosphoribosylglycinamide formyltransferase [Pusillimonas caeni]|uniref:phosphoribosylglycinamide formyltransferase n=1 Tax=Pusillimonas caeni TaxID=1348472 RepID=UPI000E5A0C57|nr:phosphoribosylglycinamide formyltransferase [Pusillimonas caeni]TFL11414.1 phosphoribosylglycinamide formyltransferase [Pusillimonas caeni]
MPGTNSCRCRFVVLVSGRGSNMRAIVQTLRERELPAEVCAVVSSSPRAAALGWAREQGIATEVLPHQDYASRELFDAALAQAIEAYRPDYVLLAGFMRVLTTGFVERFNGRLVNIHPSLLPSFPGLHTHQQALAMGVQWHGCTVHFVTPVLDHGPIIAQGVVPVLAGDTPADLADRLLQVEHRVYGEVVGWLARGQVTLDAMQRVQVRGVANRSFILPSDGGY